MYLRLLRYTKTKTQIWLTNRFIRKNNPEQKCKPYGCVSVVQIDQYYDFVTSSQHDPL